MQLLPVLLIPWWEYLGFDGLSLFKGGRTGDAHTLFLKRNCVAIGWPQMGDLGKITADRDAFKAKVSECFPEAKPGAIPNVGGQLFRFVHEIKEGDYVIYPSKQDRRIHIGKIRRQE